MPEGVGGGNNGSTTSDWTNYCETIPSNYLETALWLESDRMGYLLDTLDLAKLNSQRDGEKRAAATNIAPITMLDIEGNPVTTP